MKATTILTAIFNILLFSSCRHNLKTQPESEIVSPIEISTDSLNVLLDKSILKGDTNSYNSVASYYFIRSDYSAFLNYSLLMANKHHYNKAYYDVYFILTHPHWGEKIIDSTTKSMSDRYLLESSKLGYNEAINEINQKH